MPRGYRQGVYDFVIDSNFQPFSMQELLVPFNAYKDAYEKSEEAYIDLSSQADKFKYLSDSLPEGSKARQIYEGYANDLKAQATDLAQNGLNMANRRALTNLRRRYSGEIGMLDQAKTRLDEEMRNRNTMRSKGIQMLYADENPTIDDYLGENTPNLYGISGEDLNKTGMLIGQQMSSRQYSAGDDGSTLGGLYRRWKETKGVADIGAFMHSPEVMRVVQDTLKEKGVIGNLTGNNLDRAALSLMNGIYNGIVYEESVKPIRDENVLDVRDRISLAKEGLTYDANTGKISYDINNDPSAQRQSAIAELNSRLKQEAGSKNSVSKGSGNSAGSGKSGKMTQGKKRIRFTWDGNDPEDDEELATNPKVAPIEDDEEYVGTRVTYDELPQYAKDMVDKQIGNGKAGYYDYYFTPFKSGGIFNDTEAELDIVPRSIVTDNPSVTLGELENDSDLE